MVAPDSTGTLLLERPFDAPEFAALPMACAPSPESVDALDLELADDRTAAIGPLLRAPGLALLAAVFLIEGYRWLGVIHLGSTGAGSFLFGTVGLALVVLTAPWVVLSPTSGRRTGSTVAGGLLSAVALAVLVATGAALVVGGQPWRAVAGVSDLLLAATALGAVVLGERARRHAERAVVA